MSDSQFDTLLRLAVAVTESLRNWPAADAPVGAETVGRLLAFAGATEEFREYRTAGELARSLAVLLLDSGDTAGDRQQIDIVRERLSEALDGHVQSDYSVRVPLVTPVARPAACDNPRVVLHLAHAGVADWLSELLEAAGFTPLRVSALGQLLDLQATESLTAIVADLELCRADPQAPRIFSMLRQHHQPAPHLLCIADVGDIPARLEAVRLGATRFFSRPLDATRLLELLKSVTLQVPEQPYRVLVVEDDRLLGELYRMALRRGGMEARVTHDPLQVPEQIAAFAPDVVLSDVFMPGCNGLELLALLRQDDLLTDTPIIFLTSDDERDCRLEALDLGGDDFLVKPVDMALLIAIVRARAKRARVLKQGRGEYRRLIDRLRELEKRVPETYPCLGAEALDYGFPAVLPLEPASAGPISFDRSAP